jgi:hypothetical protein
VKHLAPLTDEHAIAAIKPGDVVHVLARVVEVFPDGPTVDVVGERARYRVHPRHCLVVAVEQSIAPAGNVDVIELLCGAHGRVIADDLMRARRAGQ